MNFLPRKATAKEQKSVVRVTRSFPFFGPRSVMLFFPRSVDSAFSVVTFAELKAARVYVERRSPAGSPETGEDVFDVKASHRAAPILTMRTDVDAKEVVQRLSDALAPNRMKRVWWTLGLLLAVWIIATPDRPASTGPRPLSIHTPITPALPQPQLLPPVAPSAAAQLAAPVPQAQVDQNDPFGLKIVPPAK